MNVCRSAWKSANSGPSGVSITNGMPAALRSACTISADRSCHVPGHSGAFASRPAA
nr:hypothetical protein [Limnoglobus roseus]